MIWKANRQPDQFHCDLHAWLNTCYIYLARFSGPCNQQYFLIFTINALFTTIASALQFSEHVVVTQSTADQILRKLSSSETLAIVTDSVTILYGKNRLCLRSALLNSESTSCHQPSVSTVCINRLSATLMARRTRFPTPYPLPPRTPQRELPKMYSYLQCR